MDGMVGATINNQASSKLNVKLAEAGLHNRFRQPLVSSSRHRQRHT